jgi:hypothetical protein
MSTFSSAGENRKERLKKLGDLMDTCCFLDNKHGIAKASLFNVQKNLKGNSASEAGNNEGTDGHNPNIREVGNGTATTDSAVLRLPL